MPVYAWKGLNNAGKAVAGTKDADGPKALRATLRRDGIYVTEHREMLGGAAAARGGSAVAVAGVIVLITNGSSAETEKPATPMARLSLTPWISSNLLGGGARLQF